ncbi:MAG: hypothetical protein AAFR62_13645 [Cyanobacteria bacterium J06629_2]
MLESNIFKLESFSKILFLLAPLFLFAFPNSTRAGCVASDVNAQYVIGSRFPSPSAQSNNTDVQFGETCLGNNSHGNNLQIYSGVEPVEQKRERNVYLNSEGENRLPLLQTPNIDVRVNQQQYLPVLP